MINTRLNSAFKSLLARATWAARVLILAALGVTSTASAAGLVYIEAGDGINGTLNLARAAGGTLDTALDSAQSIVDDKWGLRTLGVNGNVYESTTTANPGEEDSPELKLTLSTVDGLVSGASYDVYVAYWSATGQNWNIKGGLTSGNHTLFNRTPVAFLPAAATGTPASQAVWTTGPALETEADRVMLLGKVGTANALGGQIDVFIDDLPTEAFPESTGAGAFTYRSWLDGVAFIEAGLGITLGATVDRGSGKIKLLNNTNQSLSILGYSLTSAAGALDPSPTKWLSISNNTDGDNGSEFSPDIWNITAPVEPFPAAATALTEASTGSTGGPLTAAPDGLDLGDAWIRTPIQDLQITVTLADQSSVVIAPTYIGTPIMAGDLDGNNDVDVADYIIFSANLHTNVSALTRAQAYKLGDLTNDLAIDFADFIAFRTAFNSAHGTGAFEALFGVPEPAAAALMACGFGVIVSIRRRRAPLERARGVAQHGNLIDRPMRFRRGSPLVRHGSSFLLASLVIVALSARAHAQLVSGWGLETGQQNATLTEGVAGAFSTTVPTGNAGPRALLSSPANLVNVGDIVLLSGTVATSNAPGNQQLRWGLYNTNSHATGTLGGGLWSGGDPAGWLGYMTQLGGGGAGGGNQDRIAGRNGTGAGIWLSNTDAYTVGVGPGAQPSVAANTPYNFALKLTRTGATSVKTDFSFVGGAVNRSGSFTDNGGLSASNTSFNAVGFLLNGNTGSGTLSNVSVTTPQELRLRVNKTTGGVTIVNAHNIPFDINYYRITSASSALNPTSWHSFDDQESIDGPGLGWVEAGGSAADLVAESTLGTKTLPASTFTSLGQAFNIGGAEDLVFSYNITGQSALTSAFVEYVTGGVPGDYNDNQMVDLADYAMWREAQLNAATTLTNRGPGITGTVGQADYNFWRSHFGAVSGAAGGSEIGVGQVPEPATMAMAVVSALLWLALWSSRAKR